MSYVPNGFKHDGSWVDKAIIDVRHDHLFWVKELGLSYGESNGLHMLNTIQTAPPVRG